MRSSQTLISCHNLSKSFGSKELFSNVSIAIFEGSKIGLVGKNGAGKTTLLKILSGVETQDSGEVIIKNGMRIAYIPQHPKSSPNTVWQAIYDIATENSLHIDKDPETWTSIILSRFGFSNSELNSHSSTPISQLSGGWQKRVDIAKAFTAQPDLYLFDEPTNHLDMESIEWLEQFIRKELNQYLIVSHDRSFLDIVSKSIIEINSHFFNGHFEVEGSYSHYLIRREEYLQTLMKRSQGLASKVRIESDWLSRGPKARTTKAEARVKSALQNIDELKDLKMRLTEKKLSLEFQDRECETRKLITLKNISYTNPTSSQPLFTALDLIISPRMRIGIVGPNGSGKTTFLKLIAQEIVPTQGTIKYAPGIKVVYFDQTRNMIPENWTLGQALGNGREFVDYSGIQIHVRGWAKKFLFDPNRLNLPVAQLSGGEKARLYIARLITQPADILILDEPTNDLDIDTLEVLEECLEDFQGAVLLVCHDRTFLKNVSTSLLALRVSSEKKAEVNFYPDIDQWQKAVIGAQKNSSLKKEKGEESSIITKQVIKPNIKKLSYKEEKEFNELPLLIETGEQELQTLQTQLLEKPEENTLIICNTIAEKEKEISKLWSRWEELDAKKSDINY